MTELCPICGLTQKDQHSLSQAGICDGLRYGRLRREDNRFVPIEKAQKEQTRE